MIPRKNMLNNLAKFYGVSVKYLTGGLDKKASIKDLMNTFEKIVNAKGQTTIEDNEIIQDQIGDLRKMQLKLLKNNRKQLCNK